MQFEGYNYESGSYSPDLKYAVFFFFPQLTQGSTHYHCPIKLEKVVESFQTCLLMLSSHCEMGQKNLSHG